MLGARAGPAGATARRRGWPTCLERGFDVFFLSRSKTRSRLREERKEPSSLLSFSLCFSSVHILFLFISSFSHHPAAEHGSAAEDMVHAVWCIKRERERERKRGGKTNGECLMFYIVVPVSSFLSFYPSLTPGATAATGT